MILWEIIHRPNTHPNPSNCGLFIREAGGGVYVAKVHRRNGTDEAPDEKAFANARLMAEAPAMRAVIERFIKAAMRGQLRLSDSNRELVSDAKVILMMIDGKSIVHGLTMAELERDMAKWNELEARTP